jgi:hypothetical protein
MAHSRFRPSVSSLTTPPPKLAVFPRVSPAPSARKPTRTTSKAVSSIPSTCPKRPKTTAPAGAHKPCATLLSVCPKKLLAHRGPVACSDRAQSSTLSSHVFSIGPLWDWVNQDGDDARRIFFLNDVAGASKSAIAHEVARRFDTLKRLGSSYCFDRAHQADRSTNNVFSTIARVLADIQNAKQHC